MNASAQSARVLSAPTRRLSPQHAFDWRALGKVWVYRELLYFLVWRDIKVRYKQTALGACWAVVQPLTAMAVFTVFFGRLAHVPSDGLPYPVFSLCALVPWTYCATAVASASSSLVGQQHIISKVYFPRLLVPLASVAAPLVDSAIAFVILVALMAGYLIVPTFAVLWLPAFILLAVFTAAAAGVWLSALTVRFRDVRYVVPFAVQIWMFVTPIAYPASIVPARWRTVYGLNPMAAVIEGFRWTLVGGPPPGPMAFVAVIVVAIAAVLGLVYFRRVEGTFADLM